MFRYVTIINISVFLGDSISNMINLAGSDYKRQIAITELMDTEETFMADMSIMLDVREKQLLITPLIWLWYEIIYILLISVRYFINR